VTVKDNSFQSGSIRVDHRNKFYSTYWLWRRLKAREQQVLSFSSFCLIFKFGTKCGLKLEEHMACAEKNEE